MRAAGKNDDCAHVELIVPDRVKKALRIIHGIAKTDARVREELHEWWDGKRGPVLFAPRVHDQGALGTFYATLEFTQPFAEFLAASGAWDLNGHVG